MSDYKPLAEDIRSRAISFARHMEFNDDVKHGLAVVIANSGHVGDCSDTDNGWAQFRIGIDNMIANGFEIGYAAAIDDQIPRRALVDRLPWSRAARAARRDRAVKLQK